RSLETIVLKAMACELRGRYPTARDLADDLRRWLANQPIHARPISLAGRLRLRWKREPRVVATTAALFIVLIVGAAISGWQWWRAETSLAEVVRQRVTVKRVTEQAQLQDQAAKWVKEQAE